mmetsp:Transcript_20809/g.58186  ORF Transcript_20809/g.58186 Transcript_20809/m.58186 type:complete len:80 (-) Transcript_20809:4-243(-)
MNGAGPAPEPDIMGLPMPPPNAPSGIIPPPPPIGGPLLLMPPGGLMPPPPPPRALKGIITVSVQRSSARQLQRGHGHKQ